MTWRESVVGFGRALTKPGHVGDLLSTVSTARARSTPRLTLPQTSNQFSTQLPTRHHVDGVIDRLVRDRLGGIFSKHTLKCARNLLGRPAFVKVMTHHIKENRVARELRLAPLHDAQLTSPLTRSPSTVRPTNDGVAANLTADRRSAATQRSGNCPNAGILASHNHDRGSLFSIKMFVSFLHRRTLSGCCT
jgi:hypothetical protein